MLETTTAELIFARENKYAPVKVQFQFKVIQKSGHKSTSVTSNESEYNSLFPSLLVSLLSMSLPAFSL